jgi:hypothetical protein
MPRRRRRSGRGDGLHASRDFSERTGYIIETMTDAEAENLELKQRLLLSDRIHAELQKLLAEAPKLLAEQNKLQAEQSKLMVERLKIERDRSLAPWQVAATMLTAGAALFAAGIAFSRLMLP